MFETTRETIFGFNPRSLKVTKFTDSRGKAMAIGEVKGVAFGVEGRKVITLPITAATEVGADPGTGQLEDVLKGARMIALRENVPITVVNQDLINDFRLKRENQK